MIRILRLLVPASVLAMFVCETALISASYVAAVYLDDRDPHAFLIDQGGWMTVAVTIALMLLGMHFRKLYSELRIRSRILLLQELSLVMGATFIAEALMTYFGSAWALPRSVLLPGSALALASVFVWRILFSAAVRNRLGLQRVLFIGFPPAASTLSGYLDQHPETGFAPIGYLDQSTSSAPGRLQRLGSPADLDDAVEQHRPNWIVIGKRSEIAATQIDDLVELRFGGVQIEDVENFYERTTGRAHAASVRPQSVLPDTLLPDPVNLRLQSIYATLVVLFTIPVAVPLMGAIAVAIRIATGGPVLLRETRIGLSGLPITVFRFRQMAGGAGIDRYLAKVGLDRLPQLWNVLRGEMSLVGPEADRPEFAARLNEAIPFHSWRLLLHPGLTGWAQVHQHTDEAGCDAIRRLEYDLYYMKNLSPLLDLFVLLRWLRSALPFSDWEEL